MSSSPPDSPLASPTLLHDSDDYIIRALTSTDIPAARALLAKLQPNSSPQPPIFFTQLITHPSRTCLLAFPSPSAKSALPGPAPPPVALIATALSVPPGDLPRGPTQPALTVLALGVLPAHRHRHLATRLVSAAAAIASAAPTGSVQPRVRAAVPTRDARARGFWKALGFAEEVETRPWRAGWRDEVVLVEGSVGI